LKIVHFTATLVILLNVRLLAQDNDSTIVKSFDQDATIEANEGLKHEIDLFDVAKMIIKKDFLRKDTSDIKPGKVYASAVPGFGYTLITGYAFTIGANAAFYLSKEKNANLSSIASYPTYTQYKQTIIPFFGNIWTKRNKYNIQFDWSYKKFPQNTYGLGGYTQLSDAYKIDYTHVRLFQTILKSVAPDFYLGVGYNLDYFWNVSEINPPTDKETDFQKYGITKSVTTSGLAFNILYDLRRNSINPRKGSYANITYRPNFIFLGSSVAYQTLQFDYRKYFHLNSKTKNTLALWSYTYLTLAGLPPFLSLPFTGVDTYGNSGRGFIIGRFRGKNMLYAEAEYRFALTHNGLLGAVVFANVESVSEINSNSFETVLPAAGGGLRIKLNKHSKTNIAIDYGFGKGGSQGIFVNLGEVF
jgi:outer membrane protein assembly factor BamA